ncbi:MAG: 3-deoxy-D-manno-octulosonic acid transferase [candidate division Zixibacteria bacterium]
MLFIYRIFVALVIIIGSPFLFVKAFFGKHGIRERFGFVTGRELSGRLFWFHAASVGEQKIIQSILPEIRKRDKRIEIAISTSTITGKRRAEELFGDQAHIFLQPLEIKSSIERVIKRLRPEKLIIVETEIWPLMLSVSKKVGLELFLINARMREKSFGKYKLIKSFFAPVLKNFSIILAQSSADADRFQSLGAENVTVIGNLKYDQIFDNGYSNSRRLSIEKKGRLVLVAGSVRKGEDDILADVIVETRRSGSDIGYIIAPRHMKEIEDMTEVFSNRGIRYRLRSKTPGDTVNLDSVLILNTMGELRDFYNLADLTFVGGSLVPIGGHDPLEPASLGKPVIFGPHMENAREASKVLLESGGATEVRNREDIINILKEAGMNREALKVKGEICKKAVLSMTGASEKTAKYLMGELN